MRKNMILILISIFMFMPLKVNALTGSLNMTCTSVNGAGESTCTIKGTSDAEFTGITAQVTVSDNLEIVSFIGNSIWEGSDFNNNKIDMYASCDGVPSGQDCVVNGNFVVGTVKVKTKDNFSGSGTVKLSSIKLDVDQAGGAASVADVTAIVKTAGLKSLTVSDESGNVSLQPGFSVDNDGYSVTINSKTFNVNAVANNSSDSVTIYNGDTDEQLSSSNITYDTDGKEYMLIEIKVGSGNDASVYQIIVNNNYKDEELVCDNSLKSLTVGGKTVSLQRGKYDYEVTLSSDKNYSYKATLSDTDNYEFDSVSVGEKTNYSGSSFVIKVVSKNKECTSNATYNITVKTSSSGGSSTVTPSSKPSNGNVSENPNTGNVPMLLMAMVLGFSFVISLSLYKKNISGYGE